MREILFRGKRLDYGIWEEGYYSPKDLLSYDAEPVDMPCIIREKDLLWCRVDPATVGQCVGLKDMNGKWIFEGDIVQIGEENGKIEYSETEAMFQVVFDVWCTDFDHYFGTDFEVIGNIHDNPELLEGEQNDR